MRHGSPAAAFWLHCARFAQQHCNNTAIPLQHHCKTPATPLQHHCNTTTSQLQHHRNNAAIYEYMYISRERRWRCTMRCTATPLQTHCKTTATPPQHHRNTAAIRVNIYHRERRWRSTLRRARRSSFVICSTSWFASVDSMCACVVM